MCPDAKGIKKEKKFGEGRDIVQRANERSSGLSVGCNFNILCYLGHFPSSKGPCTFGERMLVCKVREDGFLDGE